LAEVLPDLMLYTGTPIGSSEHLASIGPSVHRKRERFSPERVLIIVDLTLVFDSLEPFLCQLNVEVISVLVKLTELAG
jgi:hypothetical protein